jgi:hypothetical protein
MARERDSERGIYSASMCDVQVHLEKSDAVRSSDGEAA